MAEDFLRENLRQSAALRSHHADPAAYPKPETAPLNARERNLLFFGRAPERHTPEMRELRHYWGLSRTERAARAEALRQGQLSPSPTLEQMLAELETRRSVQAIRHYQAAILNEEMRNPGKLDLRPMFDRLPPHERAFLIERIEAKKQPLTRPQMPAHDPVGDLSSRTIPPPAARPFASIPRESNSYREYMASMGSIELRLLNETVQQRQKDSGHIVISKEEHPLSITEARALLPREEQVRIREQARNLAWEQIAPPEVFASQPEPAALRLSDTVAHLQEKTQQRARLAHQALDEFVREKGGFNGRNDPHSADSLSQLEPADAQRLRALEDYAARTREELYRGFESLDALRRELEKPRGHGDAGRNQPAELMPHSAPVRDRILSLNGHSAGKDLQLFNGSHFDSERNSTVGADTERLPETLESRSWLVDSDQKWHFDSLPSARDATSDRDFIVDSGRDDISHDFIYDR